MASSFSNQLKNISLIKPATDLIYNYRNSLLPIFAFAAFGGTSFYLIYRSRALRGNQALNQDELKSGLARKSKDDSLTGAVLSDLPPETRSKIWEKLDYDDLLKLRRVAVFTKDDVDNWVGVRVRISSKFPPDRYGFSQRVALQGCVITDISQAVEEDFFLNPALMRDLQVIENSPIDLRNLVNLLVPCVNLRKLQLHFLYTVDLREVSEMTLHAIPYMQNLEELKLFRISIQGPTFKSIIHPIPQLTGCVVPTKLTLVEIEIPDVPDNQVTLWKYVLEKQTHLITLTLNVGAVNWQFVRKIIQKNPCLERISLEGFCNLNTEADTLAPFDWGIFENCVNLRTFEIGCPAFIDSEEYEPMPSINFRKFPCKNIEEFYVYKILMAPEDVRRVYSEMKKMSNGSLNQIGEPGTEAAAEMFWIQAQQQETHPTGWLDQEQWFDIIANSALGLSILAMMFVVSRSRPIREVIEDHEMELYRQ